MTRNRNSGSQNMAQVFDSLRADYDAAKTSRFRRRYTGVSATPTTGDYHYRNEGDYLRMMELSREFDRNNIVVGQGVTRVCNSTLQGGINVDPQTGDEELNRELQARIQAWGEDPLQCDISGRHTFADQMRLALRGMIVDGDSFALPTEGGALQLIEAHRVRTPSRTKRNVVNGVLLDQYRRPLEYWVTKDEIDPGRTLALVRDTEQYRALDSDGYPQVFHLFNPKRASQTRGVSALAPVADVAGMHDDVQFAKLVQQQIVSCFAILRKFPDPDMMSPGLRKLYGETESTTLGDGTSRILEGIGPGMEIEGRPGEEIDGFSPNVPNAQFFEHALLLLTFIAINLELPVHVLLLDPSRTNFSGWRGAIEQAKHGWRQLQNVVVSKMQRPIYTWKLRQWIAEDPALRRQAAALGWETFSKHRWMPPAWPYIQPEVEAKADAGIVENGLDSRRGVLAKRGLDIDIVDQARIADNVRLIEQAIVAANGVTERTGVTIGWREVLNPTIAVVAPVAPVSEDDETPEPPKAPEDDSE